MEHYTNEALWGSIWARRGLDLRVRLMVTLSVLTCLQRLPQLRTYLNSSLNAGLLPGEVQEVLIQCSAFGGFPVIVNALELYRDVLEARGTTATTTAPPEAGLEELDARGSQLWERLFGEPDSAGPDDEAAAVLDCIERRFVLGEIFQRPGLELAERALCAFASVIALGAAEAQRSWARACLRIGVGAQVLEEVVLQVAHYAGFPAARTAVRVLREVAG